MIRIEKIDGVSNLDIKNLNTFILVSELNSFTKAAEKSGYSQSTISFQIKQLERELNSQLFERINHTVALTEKGREVLKYAHQIHKLTQELETNMREVKMSKAMCVWLWRILSVILFYTKDFQTSGPSIRESH